MRHKTRKTPTLEALAWVVIPTVAVVGVIIGAMHWPATVRIEANIVSTRMSFHTSSDVQNLLRATRVLSLSLSRFDTVRIPIGSIEVADPRRRNTGDFSWPSNAWRPVSFGGELALHPLPGREARILITSTGASPQPLAMNSLATPDADVTLILPEKDVLALDVLGANGQGSAQLSQEVEMTIEDCDCSNTPLHLCAGAVTLRLRPSTNHTIQYFFSHRQGIYAQVKVAPGALSLIPDRDLSVSRVEFRDLDEYGRPISTIRGEGRVFFMYYPNTPPVTLSSEDFLDLNPHTRFYIRSISEADDHNNLRIRLGGTTGKLECGPRGAVHNKMPTWFDLIWKNSNLVALFAVITWLVPVLVGSRKLYRQWAGQKK